MAIRRLSNADLTELLARRRIEGQALEFKRSLSLRKEACADVCAMVNAEPAQGTIIFGIESNGAVVGVEPGDLDSAQRTLTHHLHQTFEPTLPHTLDLGEVGDRLLMFLTARRDRSVPFHEYSNVAYIREGSTTRALSLQEKQRLVKRRDRDQHVMGWKCDACGSMVGILMADTITIGPAGMTRQRGYGCRCGGEYWPLE